MSSAVSHRAFVDMYVIGFDPGERWRATSSQRSAGVTSEYIKDFHLPLGFAPGTRGITDERGWISHPSGFNPISTAGNEYVCIRMKSDSGRVGSGSVVICDNASWTGAQGITKTLLDANLNGNMGVLVSPGGLSGNEYGWVLVKGIGFLEVVSGATEQAQLYTSATAGVLGSTSSSQTAVYGVSAITVSQKLALAQVLYPTGLL